MINKPAQDAYRVASQLAKLYAKLDVARNVINDALDETPANFDQCQFDRIMDIRDKLNREIGLIFDLSKREAHRICNQLPDSSPAENRKVAGSEEFELLQSGDIIQADDQWFEDGTWKPFSPYSHTIGTPFCPGRNTPIRRLRKSPAPPADSPDDWVTQDLVPPREQIDQVSYTIDDEHWNVAGGKWNAMHGADFGSAGKLLVRCLRKDLPTQNRQVAASDSPAPPPEHEHIKIWFSHAGAIYSNHTRFNPLDRELKHDGKGFFLEPITELTIFNNT